jgi:succinoglycan biosynthesis protein ExoV
VHGVRGFLSARTLGLPDEKALTDPAVLLRRVYRPSGVKKFRRAYMPWFLHANPTLERVCREAGFGYIDPGGKVEQVLDQITGTEVLFTEAMHGAIVADALRVPWVPVVTQALVEPYKWQDWLSVLGMEYEPHRVGWLPLRPGRRDFWKYGRRIQNAVSVRTVGFSLQRLARKAKPRLSREGLVEDLTQRLEEKLAHLSAYTNC